MSWDHDLTWRQRKRFMQKCHSTLVPDSFKRCILFIPISFLSISMTIFSFFTFTVSFSHSDKKKKIIWLAISCALSSPVHCHLLCIASLHCQCALPVCPISVTSHGERGSILCKCHAHSSTLWECLLVSTLIQSLWEWCTFHCSPLLSEISPSHFHLHFYFHIFFAHCAWSIGHALKMETERKPSQLVGDQVIKHFHTFHFLTLISLCSLFTFTFLFSFHFASAQMHWHHDLAWRQRKCFMQASTCAHKQTTWKTC